MKIKNFMREEIFQQPEIMENIFLREEKNIKKIASDLQKKELKLVMIAARGTSDNAAILAKYLFEYINKIPVSLASPSIFTLYNVPLKLKNSLVIGISQSGKAADVLEVIKKSKKLGAITLGITNDINSPLAKVADYIIQLRAGKEKSVAATKTYTAELVSLYLLCSYVANEENFLKELRMVPQQMKKVLALEEYLQNKVERYRYIEECIALARGFNFATAQETALKLEETCYIVAEPFSCADFLHGPIALIESEFPAIIFAPSGKSYKMVENVAVKLKRKKAELLIISDKEKILSLANLPFKIPFSGEEIFTPLSYILFGQLFAYHLALAKSYSPDKPRYLKKITRTL